MGFLTVSKVLLILTIPFLIFLIAANQLGFDKSYYTSKISEYQILKNVPEAISLNEKTIDFVSGNKDALPEQFNEREKQHLIDVRNAVKISRILLYILIFLFMLLLILSIHQLKSNNLIKNFAGKILAFGGLLTIVIAALLFIFINFNFSSTFEMFHIIIFEQGTYTFDPSRELLVNIYPEQLFMDLGLRISKAVIFMSTAIIAIGLFLLKSKRVKNKIKSQ